MKLQHLFFLLSSLVIISGPAASQDNCNNPAFNLYNAPLPLSTPFRPSESTTVCTSLLSKSSCCSSSTLSNYNGTTWTDLKETHTTFRSALFSVVNFYDGKITSFFDSYAKIVEELNNETLDAISNFLFSVEDSTAYTEAFSSIKTQEASCFETLLAHTAGMFCAVCSPEYSEYFSEDALNGKVILTLSQEACQTVSSSCTGYAASLYLVTEFSYVYYKMEEIIAKPVGELDASEIVDVIDGVSDLRAQGGFGVSKEVLECDSEDDNEICWSVCEDFVGPLAYDFNAEGRVELMRQGMTRRVQEREDNFAIVRFDGNFNSVTAGKNSGLNLTLPEDTGSNSGGGSGEVDNSQTRLIWLIESFILLTFLS